LGRGLGLKKCGKSDGIGELGAGKEPLMCYEGGGMPKLTKCNVTIKLSELVEGERKEEELKYGVGNISQNRGRLPIRRQRDGGGGKQVKGGLRGGFKGGGG